jgi:outer membrane beta-barrel protein
VGVQPADSFRRQFEWGFSWAYHITESFGIEGLHAAFLTNYNTGLDDTIEQKTGLKTDFGVTPVVVLGSTLIWTPFKSKAATRANVYHFETYFNLGGGLALGETSNDPLGIFGVGFRAFLNRRSIMKIELRDYMQFSGSSKHRLSFLVGGGFLL